jgi:hypothetical protein
MKFETVERDEESLTTKVPRIWFFDSLAINLLLLAIQENQDMIFIYSMIRLSIRRPENNFFIERKLCKLTIIM